MLKMEKEYNEKYGDIPITHTERIAYILQNSNLRRYKREVYDEIDRIGKIKWKKLEFTIYLIPKGTPRPRSGKGGVFYVKGAADNKKFLKNYLKEIEEIPIIKTPAKFYCKSFLPIPSSFNVIDRILAEMGFIYPTTTPDWDNLGKAYCDMIQDNLIYNDAQIVDGYSSKRYSIKPRIEICIEYMEDFDCEFNHKKIKE